MLVCLSISLAPGEEAAGALSTAEARLGIFNTFTNSLALFSSTRWISLSPVKS